jgi:hypothetical protein
VRGHKEWKTILFAGALQRKIGKFLSIQMTRFFFAPLAWQS